MTRPLPAEPRKPLTKHQFAMLALRQEGKCGCGCGRKLDFQTPRAITDEHILALFEGGSNDLDNRALYVTDPCAKVKTAGEKPVQAKIRRRQGKTGQQKRLRERGHGSIPKPKVSGLSKDNRFYRKPEWPKGRKLASKGFER
ncbi:hypothetical protein [Henriciella sp.]|uniref:hypothetical protein n=1 Tax=Henriciella sp. TaxID=1968823 RepID=UPI002628F2FA|nr:hypothetical protein [Henriciella sp.]